MSLRAVTAFPIHDENESSFHRGILKQKDAGPVLNDASSGVPSVVKPTLAPKSERKALSTLNNNALNSRVLPGAGKLGLGKPGAPGSILKPFATEKKPKIQFLPVSTTLPAPVASQVYIPADEELVCSGSTTAAQWDSLQDPLDSSLLQYEKQQLLAAADEEREHDRLEQEERDRQRAANVMLEELAKEMTDMFEDHFTAIDYFT